MALRNPVNQFKRWYFYRSYYPQLGLLTDDIINHDLPEVQEAVRRLPKKVYFEREFRISRALHLSLQKTTLPKEEWTDYDKDEPYLQKYLEDVKDEWAEKKWWSKLN